jgi:hypothetical protein
MDKFEVNSRVIDLRKGPYTEDLSMVFACILCMFAFWMASVLSSSVVELWHLGALPNDQLLVLLRNVLKKGFLSDWCSPGPGDVDLSFLLFIWGR